MKNNNLIAHRGLFDNIHTIENTVPAFQKCIDQNIPFELDVQLTLDQKIVVFHDDDLKRLGKKDIVIQEANYEDFKHIHLLDSNAHIPLLSEILKLNQDNVFIDIEIKNTKRIKETVFYLMKELENYHNYSLKSFNPRIIRYIKKHYPSIQCGLLIHSHYDSRFHNFLLKTPFVIPFSKADFLAIHKKLLHQKKYLKLSSKYPIQVWTIKDMNEIEKDKNYTYICNHILDKKNKS